MAAERREVRKLTPQQYRWLMEGLQDRTAQGAQTNGRTEHGLEQGKMAETRENTGFSRVLWYNLVMKNEVNITTSSTEMMTISRAEYESLKAERDELNQKLDWLMEQVRLAKKKVYGTSSEQTRRSWLAS